jgi:pyruvate formate lyase activating enzyme
VRIAAIQKQSLIEYPGKISTVIFLAGCNFRCPWCYVPDLVLPERIKKITPISEKKVFNFLEARRNFLEAVAISGGEPTIFKDLPEFIKEIKKMGYLVELETNGSNFEMLKFLIEEKLVDYVAMDIKNNLDFEKYNKTIGGVLTESVFEDIEKSILFLLKNKTDYEFRTTLVKEFHKKEDIIEICKKIQGAKVYYLQNFEKRNNTVSGENFTPFLDEEILEILEKGKKYVNIKPRPYLGLG